VTESGASPAVGVTRIGAYVVVLDEAGRLLLCRNGDGGPEHGSWTLPGGGLEFGEDPAAGALRELEEETGLRGELDAIAAVRSRHVERGPASGRRPVHAVFLIYRGHVLGGTLRPEVGGSTDECAWLTRNEAERLSLMELGRIGVRLAFVAGEGGA